MERVGGHDDATRGRGHRVILVTSSPRRVVMSLNRLRSLWGGGSPQELTWDPNDVGRCLDPLVCYYYNSL